MISSLNFRRCFAAGLAFTVGVARVHCATNDAATQAAPVFATDANAGANAHDVVPGAAAVVDDHVIPMDDVVVTCLLKNRSYVIDQMVQGYVLDRECERRGLKVSDAEIDSRIAELRTNLAPATLDETLKLHHMSMAELRETFRHSLESPLLMADQIHPVRMLHCREILVNYRFNESDTSASSPTRTESEVLALLKEVREQIRQGKSFAELAAHYSESLPAEKQGDMGVLYTNMLGEETAVLTAALALDKGQISPPIKTGNAYCLIQAISSDSDHAKSEDSLYQDAAEACRKTQTMFLGPKIVTGLIDNSKMTFAKDEDIVAGKPLPAAAAIIDGHVIPMQEVAAKCVAEYGPHAVDIFVQNYIVDRECQRRGITVSEAEIDQRVEKLRAQMAPHTIEDGLAQHHTTMAGLRYDFRQEIERTKLVIGEVKPTRMVHARAILIKTTSPGMPELSANAGHSDAAARALAADIQKQFKAGKSFAELAERFSEVGEKGKGGDVGILFEGMHNMDTAVLNMALTMKQGENEFGADQRERRILSAANHQHERRSCGRGEWGL